MKGDPIKSIHWKASAKKDKMLVKEAQEECFGHSRVFMQLQEDRDLLDRKLGEMLFTSTYFLNHDISHKIRILRHTIAKRSRESDLQDTSYENTKGGFKCRLMLLKKEPHLGLRA